MSAAGASAAGAAGGIPGGLSPEAVMAVLRRVAETRPRVQCLTNTVAQAYTANMLLAFGAVPSMASHVDEIGAMARGAGAVLINLGTISPDTAAAIPPLLAAVRESGRPLVLDPVFVELSPLRRHLAAEVMALPELVVRGNAAEIAALSGEIAAAGSGATLVTTGAVDLIDGPGGRHRSGHGHPLMAKVTAVGCAAGALIAACCAVEDNRSLAAAAALTAYGIAGEIAATQAKGPGSFAIALIDALAGIDAAQLAAHMQEQDAS
ncbi:hydroxyethylthiazole kinase [Bosea sp. TWI1241]|uniref:hydroxyethylthiazole kinase n=1 Tax=Bosea sp. TWI1241 TaxID=3148904 RepID=UPI00320A4C4A